jgi:ribonuclease Z
MALSLRVLGCSSATPTSTRNPSAFLLKIDNRRESFLIDCGEGTQILMRKLGIRMQSISRIFISHLHGDHFLGLIGFIFSQNLLGRTEELHIYAHKPLEKVLKMHLQLEQTTLAYPLTFHTIKKNDKNRVLYQDNYIEIQCFPLIHGMPTHGFLFKHAKASFAYCSDTLYTSTILPYIQGVDLLYHEATFMENLAKVAAEKYHSTAKEAARIALKSGAKQLLIGHYSARYNDIKPLEEEAKMIFPNTIAAYEGLTIKF